ncbi:MAG: tripartite tricarboxylate transporter substrate binding protein [Betaproteobacteria bacterium]|nr:tripartite tricarboxylate transporter substrate binding protein [Betaproteobacteria bacterium]
MKKRHFLALSGSALLSGMAPLTTFAQSKFPERPIRVIVPFAPAGDGDIIGRLWVKYAMAHTGANFVVDNKAGAGGAIGAAEAARAKADGYTLLLGTSSTQIINPLASGTASYDAIKDFSLVGMVSINPTCIVVNPSVPANNLKELISLIKASPGKYAYGSAGPGTITNLTGELFKLQAGKLDVQHVPYKGGGPAMQDLVAGHVPMITPIMSSAVLAQHRAGRARIVGVNSDARLKVAPDIPTSVEAGVPDMRVQVFNAVFTPAGVPRDVQEFLRATHNKVRNDPAFLQDLEKAGAEPFSLPDPEKFIAEEVVRWTSVIKATQFKTS